MNIKLEEEKSSLNMIPQSIIKNEDHYFLAWIHLNSK